MMQTLTDDRHADGINLQAKCSDEATLITLLTNCRVCQDYVISAFQLVLASLLVSFLTLSFESCHFQ